MRVPSSVIRLGRLGLCVATGLFVSNVFPAQTLDEIIVTAQRRAQNQQDVPISLTSFSGEQIEKSNIKGATDYLSLTPNVSFTEDGQSGARGLGISVRGVNNLLGEEESAVANAIGIYLDEFSITSVPNQIANPFLPDTERVEILRGPQGTYFGRNSLGGAINLTTRPPTDEASGYVTLGVESFEHAGELLSLTGVANLPLTPQFRLRAVGYFEDSGGLVRNICAAGAGSRSCPIGATNNFTPNGTKDSGHEYLMGRLKVVWNVTDKTIATLTLMHADEKQGHDEDVPTGFLDLDTVNTFLIQEATDPGTGLWPDNRNRLSHDRPERNDLATSLAILNVRRELTPNIAVTSITGVLDANQARLFDNDLVGGADIVFRDNFYEGLSWSSELRANGDHERVTWSAGLLVSRDKQEQRNGVQTGVNASADLDPPNGLIVLPGFPPNLGLGQNRKRFEVESAALFADVSFRLGARWELITGARFTQDKVEHALDAFGLRPTCCFPFSPGFPGPPGPDFFASFVNVVNPPARGDNRFKAFTPRFGFRYEFSRKLGVYALVSRGYKAGGTSLGNSPEIGEPAFSEPYAEETLWNYELGLKSEWFDRRLRLNGALFVLDWEDLQFEAAKALRPGPVAPIVDLIINIERAQAYGGEIELQTVPAEGLSISASLG